MNTIGDMQNEMDFYGHCKKFEYIQDYVKLTMMYKNNFTCKSTYLLSLTYKNNFTYKTIK